jgi:hypothetical protein
VGSIIYGIKVVIVVLTALLFSSAWSGCIVIRERPVAVKEAGPPSWAPAEGRKAPHVYFYYPFQTVYYDTGRSIYFYPVDGRWKSAPALPADIRLDVRDCRVLEMETDRPYTFHDDVIRRHVPGQTRSDREKACTPDGYKRLPHTAESAQQ